MMVKRFLFETRLGDLMLRTFERLTGLALVDLKELESWQYGMDKPELVRQH
jgi:hypothetical protein